MILDYEDDKENMPNECDYEDLPSMYKHEDDEDDEEEDDDDLFTSEWRPSLFGEVEVDGTPQPIGWEQPAASACRNLAFYSESFVELKAPFG